VFALASLDEHMLRTAELPEPGCDITHGNIHVGGVVITGTADGSTVEVMADVDASVPAVPFHSMLLDRSVRMHVLHSAGELRKKMS